MPAGAGGDLRIRALGHAVQPLRRRHSRPASLRRRRLSRGPATPPTAPGTCCCTLSTSRLVRRGVQVYDERAVTRLAVDDGRCHGWSPTISSRGGCESFAAKFCVFATGGYGRVYRNSTNALINTGSGIGMALTAGIRRQGPGVRAVPSHHPAAARNILITEGARGEGGHLTNREGERFMARYAPRAMELAPREHRRPLHPDRDQRRPGLRRGLRTLGSSPPGQGADPGAAAGHSPNLPRFRRDRSGRRADTDPARPALFDGRHRHRRAGDAPRSTISMPPANAPA